MVTRLLPDQIAANWEFVKRIIVQNHPPSITVTEEYLANMLEAVLKSELQVWIVHESDFEKDMSNVQAIVVTTIYIEPISKTRSFVIYALVSVSVEEIKDWRSALVSISKYAKSRGCSVIVGYSDVPAMWRLAESMGGNTSTRYIYLEV